MPTFVVYATKIVTDYNSIIVHYLVKPVSVIMLISQTLVILLKEGYASVAEQDLHVKHRVL